MLTLFVEFACLLVNVTVIADAQLNEIRISTQSTAGMRAYLSSCVCATSRARVSSWQLNIPGICKNTQHAIRGGQVNISKLYANMTFVVFNLMLQLQKTNIPYIYVRVNNATLCHTHTHSYACVYMYTCVAYGNWFALVGGQLDS